MKNKFNYIIFVLIFVILCIIITIIHNHFKYIEKFTNYYSITCKHLRDNSNYIDYKNTDYKYMVFGYNGYYALGLYDQNTLPLTTITNEDEGWNDIDDNIIEVSSSGMHSLFLTRGGKVYSCGYNANGGLGLNSSEGTKKIPQEIVYFSNNGIKIKKISAGRLNHSLFLDKDGIVYGCGNNTKGYLGFGVPDGETYEFVLEPAIIEFHNSEHIKITEIYADQHRSFIISDSGDVYCTGWSNMLYTGSLGLSISDLELFGTEPRGTYINKFHKNKYFYENNINIINVSSSQLINYFLTTNGEVYCSGFMGHHGQKFNNIGENIYAEDEDITNLYKIEFPGNLTITQNNLKITQISAGYKHVLFLDSDGNVYVNGNNSKGQAGTGRSAEDDYNTETITDIVQINNTYPYIFTDKKIKQVSAGNFISLFLTEDGTVYVCGEQSKLAPHFTEITGHILLPQEIYTSVGKDFKVDKLSSITFGSDLSVLLLKSRTQDDKDPEVDPEGGEDGGRAETEGERQMPVLHGINFYTYINQHPRLWDTDRSLHPPIRSWLSKIAHHEGRTDMDEYATASYLRGGVFYVYRKRNSNGNNAKDCYLDIPLLDSYDRVRIIYLLGERDSMGDSDGGPSGTIKINNIERLSLIYGEDSVTKWLSYTSGDNLRIELDNYAVISTQLQFEFASSIFEDTLSVDFSVLNNYEDKNLALTHWQDNIRIYNENYNNIFTDIEVDNPPDVIPEYYVYKNQNKNIDFNIPLHENYNMVRIRYKIIMGSGPFSSIGHANIVIGDNIKYRSYGRDTNRVTRWFSYTSDDTFKIELRYNAKLSTNLIIDFKNRAENVDDYKMIDFSPQKEYISDTVEAFWDWNSWAAEYLAFDVYSFNEGVGVSNKFNRIQQVINDDEIPEYYVYFMDNAMARWPRKAIAFYIPLEVSYNYVRITCKIIDGREDYDGKATIYLNDERILQEIYVYDVNTPTITNWFEYNTDTDTCSIELNDYARLSTNFKLEYVTRDKLKFVVYSFGRNDYGQLGFDSEDYVDGDVARIVMEKKQWSWQGPVASEFHPYHIVPISIPTISNIAITQIAGGWHSLFLTNEGHVYSCGRNNYGQLGLNSNDDVNITPQLIETYHNSVEDINIRFNDITITQISTGSFHSLFLTNEGHVYSCGYGSYGQLGLNSNDEVNITPQLIKTYHNSEDISFNDITITQIAGGLRQSLFLTNEGHVYSCGRNNYGQLGLNSNDDVNITPQLIETFYNDEITITQIAGGLRHSLFLTSNNLVYSCGRNNYGQLGLNSNEDEKSIPQLIENYYDSSSESHNNDDITITQIACGGYQTFINTYTL